MKAKVFTEYISNLEKEVNSWLEQQKGIKIAYGLQSFSHTSEIILTIFYEDV